MIIYQHRELGASHTAGFRCLNSVLRTVSQLCFPLSASSLPKWWWMAIGNLRVMLSQFSESCGKLGPLSQQFQQKSWDWLFDWLGSGPISEHIVDWPGGLSMLSDTGRETRRDKGGWSLYRKEFIVSKLKARTVQIRQGRCEECGHLLYSASSALELWIRLSSES